MGQEIKQEIVIHENQRQILLDLMRSEREIRGQMNLTMGVILAGHGIDPASTEVKYRLSPDATKLIAEQQPGAPEPPKGNLADKKAVYKT